MPLALRAIEERDLERAGDVNFVAFHHVALTHGQVPTVRSPVESRGYLRHLLQFDPLGGVVAEEDGVVIGVAWVHPRGPVATIGPIAVDPPAQGRGVGRRLLERCFEIAGAGVPQVRLVHESFNVVSLGLYLHTGFRVVAPLLELERPAGAAPTIPGAGTGVSLRAGGPGDQSRIAARDARAFGAPRPQSVEMYLRRGLVAVAERGGTLSGYALGIGFGGLAYIGSALADDTDTLLALMGTVTAELAAQRHAVRTMIPATDRRLVDGLTAHGFRVLRPCHYMVRGGGTAPPPNYVLMNGDLM